MLVLFSCIRRREIHLAKSSEFDLFIHLRSGTRSANGCERADVQFHLSLNRSTWTGRRDESEWGCGALGLPQRIAAFFVAARVIRIARSDLEWVWLDYALCVLCLVTWRLCSNPTKAVIFQDTCHDIIRERGWARLPSWSVLLLEDHWSGKVQLTLFNCLCISSTTAHIRLSLVPDFVLVSYESSPRMADGSFLSSCGTFDLTYQTFQPFFESSEWVPFTRLRQTELYFLDQSQQR